MGLDQHSLEGLPLSASILGVCENSLENFAPVPLEKDCFGSFADVKDGPP